MPGPCVQAVAVLQPDLSLSDVTPGIVPSLSYSYSSPHEKKKEGGGGRGGGEEGRAGGGGALEPQRPKQALFFSGCLPTLPKK